MDGSVDREACPLNLAPTASTTVALAIGDALAMTLMEAKGLTAIDFAARSGRPAWQAADADGPRSNAHKPERRGNVGLARSRKSHFYKCLWCGKCG